MSSALSALPSELWQLTLSFTDASELFTSNSLFLVCQDWSKFSTIDEFWFKVYATNWPICTRAKFIMLEEETVPFTRDDHTVWSCGIIDSNITLEEISFTQHLHPLQPNQWKGAVKERLVPERLILALHPEGEPDIVYYTKEPGDTNDFCPFYIRQECLRAPNPEADILSTFYIPIEEILGRVDRLVERERGYDFSCASEDHFLYDPFEEDDETGRFLYKFEKPVYEPWGPDEGDSLTSIESPYTSDSEESAEREEDEKEKEGRGVKRKFEEINEGDYEESSSDEAIPDRAIKKIKLEEETEQKIVEKSQLKRLYFENEVSKVWIEKAIEICNRTAFDDKVITEADIQGSPDTDENYYAYPDYALIRALRDFEKEMRKSLTRLTTGYEEFSNYPTKVKYVFGESRFSGSYLGIAMNVSDQ